MHDYIKPGIFILFAVIVPAFFGAVLAYRRARSMVLWGVLSGIFPIFVLVIWYQKPLREVPGGFRLCPSCGWWTPDRKPVCRYCGTTLPPR